MIKIKNRITNILGELVLLLIILITFTACVDTTNSSNAINSNSLTIHYIDVGQADSIFIQTPKGKNMLIDAGETKNGAIKNYLNDLGVTNIDFIIETHPHEDHISEMADIIKTYNIGKVYMPKVTHTTKSFENMVNEIKAKNLKADEAKAGVSIDIENNISCNIIAPYSSDYDDLNNWSSVIHLTYGETSFLFTGDAEKLSENEILNSNVNIKSNVLKLGHHGSSSSTSQNFLDKVNPQYAVISLAKDNDYGHPHKEIIERLKNKNVKIYQTCDSGTIKVISDGKNISFVETGLKENSNNSSNKDTIDSSNKKKELIYIGNTNSKKFHTDKCENLPDKKNRIEFSSRKAAIKQNYLPCKICNP